MKYDLTHTRHDPAHCLAPGLFRSLKRGERKKQKLDITFQYGDESIRIWGPEPLGADDLRVLQGLIAMASISGVGGKGVVLGSKPVSDAGRELRKRLELQWDARSQDAMVIQGSFRQLAREIGMQEDSGGALKIIRSCIERLWAVSLIVASGGRRYGFRILSEYSSDEQADSLHVAISPRLAEAVMGRRQHCRIDMAEIRALKIDPSRLLHQRLCGWIDYGKTGKTEISTLCGYVWSDESQNANTIKTRRQVIRKALVEIESLGWSINEYARGKFVIARPMQ